MKMAKHAAPVSGFRPLATRSGGYDAFPDTEPDLGVSAAVKRILRESNPELDATWPLEPQVDPMVIVCAACAGFATRDGVDYVVSRYGFVTMRVPDGDAIALRSELPRES
ncbi:hypothetical protein [Burkholderia sp. NLJ2]|uniref:hypothetical protein n=1 Tax=Burkholderia sp. NLJ2 TaxID=3090699 RepID=UPI003C6BF57B